MNTKLRYEVTLHVHFHEYLAREPVTLSVVVGPDTLLNSLEENVRSGANIDPEYVVTKEGGFQELHLKIGTGRSCYRPYAEGLDINMDESLVEYFKKYRAEHRLLRREAGLSVSNIVHASRHNTQTPKPLGDSTIRVGPARVKFRRTLRVPDNVEEYTLPPGLGTFPLVDVQRYSESKTIPTKIKTRGGYLMPMFQREALWLDFRGSEQCAVKVSVGEVNALTGDHRTKEGPAQTQDYVSLPLQPWLDGIYTSPGIVRQFIAMTVGDYYTIEEQVMGRTSSGGIQLDVFPSIEAYLTCRCSGKSVDITRTPRQLGLAEGDEIVMECKNFPPCLTVQDYATRVSTNLSFQYFCDEYLHTGIISRPWVPFPPQEEDKALLGIAAGGQIKQKIYEDPRPTSLYDEELAERVWVHIVSTAAWEKITGVVAPITPIVPELYALVKYPWLDTFDEHLSTIAAKDGFQHVRTIDQLDASFAKHVQVSSGSKPAAPAMPVVTTGRLVGPLIDPDNPPPCSIHASATSDFVLRPCGHSACEACLGKIILRGKRCASCGAAASQFVGFKKPVPNPSAPEDGGEGAWDIDETEGAGVDPTPRNAAVVTFVLDQDRVASLAGIEDR